MTVAALTLNAYDTKRFVAVGDVHGNLDFVTWACRFARDNRCDTIVQVGDLGAFWPSHPDFTDEIDVVARRHGIRQFFFLGGNHEGWDTLHSLRVNGTGGGFHVLADRVTWVDHGTRWAWNGVRFGALGGAYSIDSPDRTPGVDWWPGLETPDASHANQLIDGGPLDILLTHDHPLGIVMPHTRPVAPHLEETTRDVRRLLRSVVDACQPELVIHGHWHRRYRENLDISVDGTWRTVRVEGLGADIGRYHHAVAVVELASSAWTLPAGPALPRPVRRT